MERPWRHRARWLMTLVSSVLLLGAGAIPAVSIPLARAATLAGKPILPLRKPDGHVLRNIRQQVISGNWSGYVVARYKTGQAYTQATAHWIVPAVSAPAAGTTGYSSSWLGIGGFCENSTCTHVDRTLIQLGTEQDAAPGAVTQYYAWYEALPGPEVPIQGLSIAAGDEVTAALVDGPSSAKGPASRQSAPAAHGPGAPAPGKAPGAPPPAAPPAPGGGPPGNGHQGGPGPGKGQTWTLSLTVTDPATGQTQSWSTSLQYDSSLDSAEWIEEAPTVNGSIAPLANFGQVTFDPGSADGTGPGLVTTDGVVMYDPQGQTSNPSAPDSDADGFAACWGAGTQLTACAAPPS